MTLRIFYIPFWKFKQNELCVSTLVVLRKSLYNCSYFFSWVYFSINDLLLSLLLYLPLRTVTLSTFGDLFWVKYLSICYVWVELSQCIVSCPLSPSPTIPSVLESWCLILQSVIWKKGCCRCYQFSWDEWASVTDILIMRNIDSQDNSAAWVWW